MYTLSRKRKIYKEREIKDVISDVIKKKVWKKRRHENIIYWLVFDHIESTLMYMLTQKGKKKVLSYEIDVLW